MNKMTKKLTLKDQEVAAVKAKEVKGGPIFMGLQAATLNFSAPNPAAEHGIIAIRKAGGN